MLKPSKKKLESMLWLKRPTVKSESAKFSLIEKLPSGKCQTLRDQRLTAINLLFKEKQISFQEAEQQCLSLLESLKPKRKRLFNSSNAKLLEEYWERAYLHRDLVDKKSAKNRLIRAIDAVGSLSILSSDERELQREVDRKFKGNAQRRIVEALNQIFKFFKTGVKLRLAREDWGEISYVTEEELKKILPHIKDPQIRLMHEVAFGTGLRAGELFGILPKDFKSDRSLLVESQIDVNRKRRSTKTRRSRRAIVFKQFVDALNQWLEIPIEERLKFRKRSISKITREASAKAIGRSITFHDLRHSYAIYMVSKGIGLTDVKNSIGDTMKVCERYYAGFISTPETINRLSKLI